MATDRRMPRSRRALSAIVVLISAVAATTVGIVVASVPVLVATIAYTLVAGIVAARLLSDEIAQLRRDWARDRAQVADGYRHTAIARSHEQRDFADLMATRVRDRDVALAALRDEVLTAEIEAARFAERLAEEEARCEALESDASATQAELHDARTDLRHARDQLAESQSAELQARAEITAWEDATSAETLREHDRRLA